MDVLLTAPRVVESIVDGKYVNKTVSRILSQRFKFKKPLEEIEYLYAYGNSHEDTNVDDNVYVGITNYRIFKLDQGEQSQVFRKDVISVKYVEGGIFRFDKILLELQDADVTIGIYESSSCKFFCSYLSVTPFDDPLVKLEKKWKEAKESSN